MSPNPDSFLSHLREAGYNSRSNKHSNALALAIAADLVRYCPVIRDRAAAGEIVYDLNFTLRAGTADWNVDLVVGSPPIGTRKDDKHPHLVRLRPATVQVAVEIKSVMTEHRKAVKNRKRDLEAHHEHVHNYNRLAVAGGVFVVNAAPVFLSSLRSDSRTHDNPEKLVQHCVDEMRSVASRGGSTGYGLEAKCVIVVDMDNINLPSTRYMTALPAPQVGDPLHYDAFIHGICEHYRQRF